MKRIGRRAKILSIVIIYFLVCSGVFLYQYVNGATTWVVHPANRNVYDGDLRLVVPGEVLSQDEYTLFSSDGDGSRYNKSEAIRKATLHAVGDTSDRINTGVLRKYKAELIGYDLVNGMYDTSQDGKTTITLSLIAELCQTAYDALDGRKGTIGVMNYKTGEILCMVSNPTFDPQNEPDFSDEAKYDGVFINRLIGGVYVPGSVFKLVTTYAAIETVPDIFDQTFTCNGRVKYGIDVITCTGTHGRLGFKSALANSCNCAFADIANQVGAEKLEEYAAKVGIGSALSVSGVDSAIGKFDLSKAAPVEVAWAGIGQYTTLVNPMQYLNFMSAVANGGSYQTPYYVEEVKSASGLSLYNKPSGRSNEMISPETAETMQEMMRNNTNVMYGNRQFPDMELCAKTGTAETGDSKKPHAWFTGFCGNEDIPLAFVVVLENTGGGFDYAIPVASTVLKKAVTLIS